MFYLTTHSVHLSYGYMASDVMVAMNYKHHCRVHSTVFGARRMAGTRINHTVSRCSVSVCHLRAAITGAQRRRMEATRF